MQRPCGKRGKVQSSGNRKEANVTGVILFTFQDILNNLNVQCEENY